MTWVSLCLSVYGRFSVGGVGRESSAEVFLSRASEQWICMEAGERAECHVAMQMEEVAFPLFLSRDATSGVGAPASWVPSSLFSSCLSSDVHSPSTCEVARSYPSIHVDTSVSVHTPCSSQLGMCSGHRERLASLSFRCGTCRVSASLQSSLPSSNHRRGGRTAD